MRPLAQHYNILGVYDDLSLDVGVYPTQRGEGGGAGAGAGKGMGGRNEIAYLAEFANFLLNLSLAPLLPFAQYHCTNSVSNVVLLL